MKAPWVLGRRFVFSARSGLFSYLRDHMPGAGRVASCLTVLLLAGLLFAGCRDEAEVDGTGGPIARAAQEDVDGYRVIFRGVVNDTLTGRAIFGVVVDGVTGERTSIVEMRTPEDFAGGIFIASPLPGWPDPGRYRLAPGPSDEDEEPPFRMVYRQGLYRVLQARSGVLNLTVVSDTLIRGTFDATVAGEVAERGRVPVRGEAEVSGSFSARPGEPGYVIGL